MFTMFEGRLFDKIVNSFLEIGYDIFYHTTDSSDYGVPQKRERIIIVGSKTGRPFRFPKPGANSFGKITSYKNVGKAINDLIKKSEMPNHIPLNHSEVVVKRYSLIPEGGKLPQARRSA